MFRLFLFYFILISITQAEGQKKFTIETVTNKDLEMLRYEADTAASALILFDIGKLSGHNLKFYRQIRIKILSKAGLDWGNRVFNLPAKGDFKVVVYNLVNGEVVAERAEGKSIYYEEVVDRFKVYKVFAPGVKVGSIIDISYNHTGPPLEWRFQERIPVLYSELIMEESSLVTFTKTFFGLQPIQTISLHEWHAVNMPAFKIEPYLSDYSNYISKFEFQISSITLPGYPFIEVSTTWKAVNNLLLKNQRFGFILSGSAFLNEFARETKDKNLTIKQKVEAAYQYIQANLKWDGSKNIYSSQLLKNKFKVDHNGSCGDINLALVSLLNKMDITAYPVVLSTRDNGMLVQYSPTSDKINYVVAYVRHGDVEMLLDATMEYPAPGILPSRCLNGQGLVVKEDTEEWIDLNLGYKDTRKNFVTINIQNDGQVRAKVVRDFGGYGYLQWADELKTNSNDKEIQKHKIQKQYPNSKLFSYDINKNDPGKLNAQESVELDLTDQFIDTGAEWLFNPFALFEYASNPFKSEIRQYPVDLVSPLEITTTVLVQSGGYTIKKIPASEKLNSIGGSATLTYLAIPAENGMQFKITLKLTRAIYTESEYLELRQFISEVVKKINTPVELVKT